MALPQIPRQFLWRSLKLPFYLVGTELIKVPVTPNTIAETLNVIEDFRLGLRPCAVNPLLDLFALEVADERLGNRVIPAVTPTTHARTQSDVFVQTVELIAAKLTSLIRMDDYRILGSPAPYSHRQRIQHQARLYARSNAPANHRA